MGLIKNNYKLKEMDLTINTAYAKIVTITTTSDAYTNAIIQIRQTRDAFDNIKILPFEQIMISFIADKELPLWKQGYLKAKENEYFADWDDDIVE